MECEFVKARDLPDAWFQLVELCYQNGRDYRVVEGSYANAQFRRELDYVTVHITHPYTRPLLPQIPPGLGIPDPVPEGMDYVERYLTYLMTDKIEPNEQYTYGSRLVGVTTKILRHHPPTDMIVQDFPSQVDEVIAKFKRGFGNNQACMTIAQPSDIHLTDPPCLRQIDCRIYDSETSAGKRDLEHVHQDDTNRLHFVVYFRSWDLWGGFPPNLAAVVHLQEYMAGEIGVEPGELICSSKGLHLYDMYWELARIRLGERDGREERGD